ncbi:hypothetical protein LXA43DRAFT_981996 [Ganoderma leucocontextum]|nr:hypothetical protein LXA43DRAFT_981996 [Ganoderma leucocontextum]
MRAENEKLRSELATLELQLSTTQHDQGHKAPSREPSSFDSNEAVHQAIKDLRRREATQSETITELQGKLDKYKEKFNARKSENETLNETLMRVTEDLRTAIEGLDDLQKDISTAEMSLAAVKKSGSNFDWKAFQNEVPVKPPKGTPQDASLKPFLSSAAFSHLPQDMLKQYGHLNLLILRPYECKWPPNGFSRGLHLLPTFVYDPTARSGDGGWIRNQKGTRVRRKNGQIKWEVLYQRQNEWYYYGTYQCVGCSPITTGESETEGFGAKRQININKALALDTVVLHKAQVAPIVLSFISALCNDGLLTCDLWGLQRTGFNHSFNDSLMTHKKVLQHMSSKPKKISQSGRDDDGRPRKKQKVKS